MKKMINTVKKNRVKPGIEEKDFEKSEQRSRRGVTLKASFKVTVNKIEDVHWGNIIKGKTEKSKGKKQLKTR